MYVHGLFGELLAPLNPAVEFLFCNQSCDRPNQVMIWRYARQPCLRARCLQLQVYRRYSSKPLAGGYRTIAQVLESSQTSDSDPPSLISVTGNVRTVRKQKRISFAAIGDGSTIQPLQVVLDPGQAEGYGQLRPTACLNRSTSSNCWIVS